MKYKILIKFNLFSYFTDYKFKINIKIKIIKNKRSVINLLTG